MLELSVYEGIPHLLAPVVTDMSEASNVLGWCVAEMERRYKLMAAVGVRNLAGYNRKVKSQRRRTASGRSIIQTRWIDSGSESSWTRANAFYSPLSLMNLLTWWWLSVKSEELIARLAQKARAAGAFDSGNTTTVRLMITGLIKANIPTRIAFQVSSKLTLEPYWSRWCGAIIRTRWYAVLASRKSHSWACSRRIYWWPWSSCDC